MMVTEYQYEQCLTDGALLLLPDDAVLSFLVPSNPLCLVRCGGWLNLVAISEPVSVICAWKLGPPSSPVKT